VQLLPGAEPFSADGGTVGFVLSHGFTGTPASMRPWAEQLAAAGFTVRLPRLPGHGTTWQDANKSRWQEWYAEVERAYDEVAARCEHVFGAGLSMGGTLVTRIAETRPLAGLVLVNPAYATERKDAAFAKYISWAVKSRPAIGGDIKKAGENEPSYDRTPIKAFVELQKLWKVTLDDLDKITAPVLMYRSREDHVVEPLSGRLLVERATGTTVREVILENSYHVATMDNDAQLIFDGSIAFTREVLDAAGHP
jgi:carboxylesterase